MKTRFLGPQAALITVQAEPRVWMLVTSAYSSVEGSVSWRLGLIGLKPTVWTV